MNNTTPTNPSKEEQKRLLTEMMESAQELGLYKKTTPLTQLIELWEKQKAEIPPRIERHEEMVNLYNLFIKDAQSILKVEREGMEEAWGAGRNRTKRTQYALPNGHAQGGKRFTWESFKQWFDENYKQQ